MGSLLANLRAGVEIPDLAQKVKEWNEAVLAHVSVEEFSRQLGLPTIAPLPYTERQRQACWTAVVPGEVEEPRVTAPPGFRTYANWWLHRTRLGEEPDLWGRLREANAGLDVHMRNNRGHAQFGPS